MIQEQTLVFCIVRQDRLAFSEREGVKFSRLANKVTGTVCRDAKLVDLIN